MLLIIAHHFSIHGGFEFSVSEISINKLWIQFIQLGGKIGVNIFVLISGYFLINAKKTKINKVLKLWIQIFMYSLGIFIIFVATGGAFGVKEIIKNMFPITFSVWWFASTYFILYLMFPYLNRLIIQLDKDAYFKFIIITTICWVLIPTFTTKSYESNALIWFMYLYTISGYVKLHLNNIKISGRKSICIALVFVFITLLSTMIFDFVGLKIPVVGKHATYFYGMQQLPVVCISIFLFIGFLNLKIKYNKIINIIATATFGVYLIHDNSYVRNFLWKVLFRNADFANSIFLIPYSLLVIILVFLVCTFIELFRIHIVEKRYLNIVEKISKHLDEYFNNFGVWLMTKFDKKFKNGIEN